MVYMIPSAKIFRQFIKTIKNFTGYNIQHILTSHISHCRQHLTKHSVLTSRTPDWGPGYLTIPYIFPNPRKIFSGVTGNSRMRTPQAL